MTPAQNQQWEAGKRKVPADGCTTWSRLNTVRPPHYVLLQQRGRAPGVPLQEAGKGYSQVLVWDQRQEKADYLERDLGSRGTKKAGTDLGTDCVIKWSCR